MAPAEVGVGGEDEGDAFAMSLRKILEKRNAWNAMEGLTGWGYRALVGPLALIWPRTSLLAIIAELPGCSLSMVAVFHFLSLFALLSLVPKDTSPIPPRYRIYTFLFFPIHTLFVRDRLSNAIVRGRCESRLCHSVRTRLMYVTLAILFIMGMLHYCTWLSVWPWAWQGLA